MREIMLYKKEYKKREEQLNSNNLSKKNIFFGVF